MENIETQIHQAVQKEAVGALAAGLIHDLNNALSSVLGFAELAKICIGSGATVEKELDEVKHAGLKARELVNQILTCIRHSDHQKMPIELTLLIKVNMKLIRALLPAFIEIHYHPGAIKGKILADPVQFQHILIILCIFISHAVKEKMGLLEIRLKDLTLDDQSHLQEADLKPGQYLQLSFSDAGDAIPGEITEQSFILCKPLSGREGSFSGLSLANNIVREMGGVISMCSASENKIIIHMLFPKYLMDSDEEPHGSIIDY